MENDTDIIIGRDTICSGEITNYWIPDFGGTNFIWTVSNGFILQGQGTNQITVEWEENIFFNTTVSVNYDNCFLGCNGYDALPVIIQNEFYIEGPLKVCENETMTYVSKLYNQTGNIDSNWSLLSEDGTTLFSVGNNFYATIDFAFPPGNYTLIATPVNPNDYCLEQFRLPIEF